MPLAGVGGPFPWDLTLANNRPSILFDNDGLMRQYA
jgi:hypothetical protein